MLKAGNLDQRITFEERTTDQEDIYGTNEGGWVDYATVWAQVQDLLPSRNEGIESNIEISRRPCRIRIRYRNDINSAMRIDLDGRKLRILSAPAELGRREGIELLAEELTTEGTSP